MRNFAILLAVSSALGACAPFPERGALGPDDGIPPRLVPLDPILSETALPAPDPGPALSDRAARLRARAAAIAAMPPTP